MVFGRFANRPYKICDTPCKSVVLIIGFGCGYIALCLCGDSFLWSTFPYNPFRKFLFPDFRDIAPYEHNLHIA